jgi:hypothetical protein
MAVFKFSINPEAATQERQTTLQPGPFLVEASDQSIGRQLLSANVVFAARRLLAGSSASCIWSEAGANECVEVDPSVDPAALQQRKEIAGIDTAHWYLNRAELRSGDGRYARMLWWPCSPEDRCPV